jgi:hypothetical protein
MGLPIPHVKPGDLITSSLFNQVLDELDGLQQQIDALEAVAGPEPLAITSLMPTGAVHIGDELRIVGTGFGDPATNVVMFDNTAVSQIKAGSTHTMLIVDVPGLQGVPSTGQSVGVFVINAKGMVSTTVTVLPFVGTIPQGSLSITVGSPGGTVSSPDTLDFPVHLTAFATLPGTYSVVATIDQWTVQVLSMGLQPLSQLSLPAGQPPNGVTADFVVRVAVPGGLSTGASATVTLRITCQQNSALQREKTIGPISVNSSAPAAQAVGVHFTGAVIGTGTTMVSGILRIPTNTLIQLPCQITLPDQTVPYTIAASATDPTGWTQIGVTQSLIQPNSGSSVTVRALIKAGSTSADTVLTMRVEKQGDSTVFGTDTMQIGHV